MLVTGKTTFYSSSYKPKKQEGEITFYLKMHIVIFEYYVFFSWWTTLSRCNWHTVLNVYNLISLGIPNTHDTVNHNQSTRPIQCLPELPCVLIFLCTVRTLGMKSTFLIDFEEHNTISLTITGTMMCSRFLEVIHL